MINYPEHEKMEKIREDANTISGFLEWFVESDYNASGLYLGYHDIEKMMYEYFEIDENKIEQEKRQMLDELRKANGLENT